MGKIRRLTIYSHKITNSKKILVYSDLHMGFKYSTDIRKLTSIRQLSPNNFDYILMPGDIVHCGSSLDKKKVAYQVLRDLKKITGNTKTYVSLGNHDQYDRVGFENWAPYDDDCIIEVLHSLKNVKVLDLKEKVVEGNLEFSAINNSPSYYLSKNESATQYIKEYREVEDKMSFDSDYYSILLTHDPKSIYQISDVRKKCMVPNTDLVVSGHMHNGLTPNFLQPYLNGYGFLSPDYTMFPDVAYGVKRIEDTIFLINGAVSSFIEVPILNDLYGINCTIINLEPQDIQKKLTYTYK